MPRKANCECGSCSNCKARIAMREKRAKNREPGLDQDPDLVYLALLKEQISKQNRER